MSLEAIKIITTAEEEARQSIILAQQNAQDMIEEVQRAGNNTIEITLARAQSEIAHLMRTLDQKATEAAKDLASTTANRQATLRARAERRLDDAAALIVERIVNS